MTTTPPIQKCRCASKTHGHKPSKCTNLATEPESKPCYDKTSEELRDRSRAGTKKNLGAYLVGIDKLYGWLSVGKAGLSPFLRFGRPLTSIVGNHDITVTARSLIIGRRVFQQNRTGRKDHCQS